jgi:hypothetical protein
MQRAGGGAREWNGGGGRSAGSAVFVRAESGVLKVADCLTRAVDEMAKTIGPASKEQMVSRLLELPTPFSEQHLGPAMTIHGQNHHPLPRFRRKRRAVLSRKSRFGLQLHA